MSGQLLPGRTPVKIWGSNSWREIKGAVSAGSSDLRDSPFASNLQLLASFFGLRGERLDGLFIYLLVAGIELFEVFAIEVLEFFV